MVNVWRLHSVHVTQIIPVQVAPPQHALECLVTLFLRVAHKERVLGITHVHVTIVMQVIGVNTLYAKHHHFQ
jgi:hypothetical protein